MNELETSYISKISLKNYKSIRDLIIDLHPGLNIIIGENGSGKTTFVQAIHSIFSEKMHPFLPIGFEFDFEFTNTSDSLKTKWTGSIKETKHKSLKNNKIKLYISKVETREQKIEREALFHSDIVNELPSLQHDIISFTLPNELPYLRQMNSLTEHPIDIDISDGDDAVLLCFNLEDELGYFDSFALKLEKHERYPYQDSKIITQIKSRFKVNNNLKQHLKRFSLIKDCRIAKSYTVEYQDEDFVINHIILEFFVNNNWYSWEQLSDGTQRLFYIISQTLNNQSLVIIEEPEIGLHPNQLFGIMDFLKEQSETKQIIITTHSPDVLNILEKNELHKIVVTRFDTENGAVMHHLPPKKMEKALRYMNKKGLALKDFWLHSNLEEYDEAQ